ncbi:DNA primase family protein [Mameliella alba]|uniref:DNA primase/helicase, phage-associated n=1 Tax=Mameliella alba TaxID=561184 RepID=A0A0B3SL02_9RHOB|nr:phage/plasmid primase, P4 family [Mameliella alba]KHQ51239.1 DNA primase/helicase, phage-associated [Mameliella alba]
MTGIEDVRATLDAAEDVTPPEDWAAPEDPGGPGDMPPPGPPHDMGGPDDPPPPEAEGALLPLNDTGNGLRFALYCGGEALYVPRVGWHIWDEKRWKLDPDGIAVRRHAQTIHDRITKEIPHLQLKEAEQRKLDRLGDVRAELRDLEHPNDRMREEDRLERRGKLLEEKDALNGALWGKGSSRQRHLTFAKSAGNSNAIKNMLTEAVTSLHRDVEDLDADPLTVNTASGLLHFNVVDMREEGGGKQAELAVLPHAREVTIPGRNRAQYITKMMPADYDPAATCPRFDKFLARVQPDPDMRAFLQRWFGLSMTALPVQKFLYCYGMGANGKSLLTNLMRRMMGDYATMVRIESLTGKNRKSGSDATPDLMRLIGARAAITNEPEEGERLQEQKVKEMTGGDEMLVRNLHSDFVAFTPYFKLAFTGNHKLEIRGTDDGIWRRPLLCPFDVQIPEGERDEKLGDALFSEERSGILNWMIAGLLDYLEGGLQEPAQVVQATEDYRKDSDPLGDFLATGCEIDGGGDFLPARELVEACYLYLLENTSHAWQPGNLQRKLKERSGKYMHPATGKTYTRHKKNGTWGYSGIRLTKDMRARLEDAPRDAKGLPLIRKDSGGSGAGEDWGT